MSRTQSSSFPGLAPSLCRMCSTSDVVMIEDLLMQGTGKGEAWTTTDSPGLRTCEDRPSMDIPAGARLRSPIYLK